MQALQYLNRYFYKYRHMLLLGLFFTVSSRIFAVLAPSLVGDSITEIEHFIQRGATDLTSIKKILLTNPKIKIKTFKSKITKNNIDKIINIILTINMIFFTLPP